MKSDTPRANVEMERVSVKCWPLLCFTLILSACAALPTQISLPSPQVAITRFYLEEGESALWAFYEWEHRDTSEGELGPLEANHALLGRRVTTGAWVPLTDVGEWRTAEAVMLESVNATERTERFSIPGVDVQAYDAFRLAVQITSAIHSELGVRVDATTRVVYPLLKSDADLQLLPQLSEALVALHNQHRADHGLGPLEPHPVIVRTASAKAGDMAEHRYLDHISPRLGSTLDQFQDAGLSVRGWGENIGQFGAATSADAIIMAFMDSPEHRKNVLSAGWTDIGVGAVQTHSGRIYIAVQFAR